MLPNSVASTRTFSSDPSSVNCKMSINSPYHAKHPVPFPSIFMLVKAVQEQFVKHACSHSELLILVLIQAASIDESGMFKRSNLTYPSPFLHIDNPEFFLTQPSEPSLRYQSLGDLGSYPVRHMHSNLLILSGLHLLYEPHCPYLSHRYLGADHCSFH